MEIVKSKETFGEIDQFVGEIFAVGDSLAITIPARIVKFTGVKKGDVLKVYFKKIKKEEVKR